ncbi:MAG: hypothetical protein VX899_22460 [Myxococcota bacterium]|nr:hypothetical protein [Myxococcota bacterium]
MWMTMLLAAPVVQAQEAWSVERQHDQIVSILPAIERLGAQAMFLALGDERFEGTTEIRGMLSGVDRRPGEDPVFAELEAMLDGMDAYAQTHYALQQELLSRPAPSTADQLQFEQNAMLLLDMVSDHLWAIDRLETELLEEPPTRVPLLVPAQAGLPGPESALPASYRANFALRYEESARLGLFAFDGRVIGAANKIPSAEEVAALQAELDGLMAQAEAREPWFGDDRVSRSVLEGLQAYQRWLEEDLPRMQAALQQGDPATHRALTAELNAMHFRVLLEVNTQAQAFARDWRFGPESERVLAGDTQTLLDAQAKLQQDVQLRATLEDTPEGQRYQALNQVAQGYLDLLTAISTTKPLLPIEDIQAALLEQLSAVDRSLQALGPSEDPYTAALLELSVTLHWQLEEAMMEGYALGSEPHPRVVHHERMVELSALEIEQIDAAIATVEAGHDAYARGIGIQVGLEAQNIRYGRPTGDLGLSFPVESALPDILEIVLAGNHSREVWGIWEQGRGALLSVMDSELDQRRQVQLEQLPVLEQSLEQAQQIPPWLGDGTLVDAAVSVLELLSASASTHVPTLLAFADSPGRRTQKRYDQAWGVLEHDYNAAVQEMEDAFGRFSEAWNLAAFEAWAESPT